MAEIFTTYHLSYTLEYCSIVYKIINVFSLILRARDHI